MRVTNQHVQTALDKMNRFDINDRQLVIKEDYGNERDKYGRVVVVFFEGGRAEVQAVVRTVVVSCGERRRCRDSRTLAILFCVDRSGSFCCAWGRAKKVPA